MSDPDRTEEGVGDLPFHEYCAHCNTRFDDTVLDPTVKIVEVEEERIIHSFCDEDCLSDWAADGH